MPGTVYTWNTGSPYLRTDPLFTQFVGPLNWSPNGVPGSTSSPGSPDVAVLTAGTQRVGGSLDNIVFSYDGASAAYTLFAVDLRFGPGFQFNISGLGTIEVYAVNTVINSGTWNIGAPGRGGRLILTPLETDGQLESFTNAGTLNVAHGATVQATGDREGVFLNSGTLSVGSGGLFTYGNLAGPVGPTFRNSGRVNLTGSNGAKTELRQNGIYQGDGAASKVVVDGSAALSVFDTTLIMGQRVNNLNLSIRDAAVEFRDVVQNSRIAIAGAVNLTVTLSTDRIAPLPFGAAIAGFDSNDTIDVNQPYDAYSYNPDLAQFTLLFQNAPAAVFNFSSPNARSYTVDDFEVRDISNLLGSFYSEITVRPGHDLLEFDEGRRGGTFSLVGNERTYTNFGLTDVVSNAAEIRFLDGRMVFDANDPAAAVTRMYQAGLGRLPDQGGLNFWIANVQRGMPLAELGNSFLSSAEFTARFGTGLDNTGFVTQIYRNVLGREPDAGGLAFFRDGLNSGQSSRGATLASIAESPENRVVTQGLVAGGIWDVDETAASVARLYYTALGRPPDAAGLSFWTRSINDGNALTDLANAFVVSAEFRATYGALDNRGFVNAVYGNTLGRPGDAEGVQFWTTALNAGASRAAVTIGFSESLENQVRTAGNVLSENPANYGIRLA